MLQYAITDLLAQGLDRPATRATRLREQVRGWAVDGVDIVQLREKQLESGEVLKLATLAMEELRGQAHASVRRTLLLVNGRADIAAAAAADGVHLTAAPGEMLPAQVRRVFITAGFPTCHVSVSCHSPVAARIAQERGADLILFSPVYEKRLSEQRNLPGAGLEALRESCALAGHIPVLALGGVTAADVPACLASGAAGIAGIRLFRR